MAVLGSFKAPGQRCFFCAVCFQKSGREIEQDALIWLGGIYYRPVYLPAVYQDHVPGSQWIRTAFHHIGHIPERRIIIFKNHGDGSCKSLKSDLLNGKGGNLLKGSLERGWGICHGKSPVFIKFVIIIYNSIICNIIQH